MASPGFRMPPDPAQLQLGLEGGDPGKLDLNILNFPYSQGFLEWNPTDNEGPL